MESNKFNCLVTKNIQILGCAILLLLTLMRGIPAYLKGQLSKIRHAIIAYLKVWAHTHVTWCPPWCQPPPPPKYF